MPFAYVNLDLLDANIRAIVSAAGDKKVRVASKSIRSIAVLRRIINSDEVFQGVMCYTAREADFLIQNGFDDLLLGYPMWDKSEITNLLRAADRGHMIVFMVDSIQHVEHIEKLAATLGIQAAVCLDIDMSTNYPGLHFGIWRSPVTCWSQARLIVERMMQSKWVRLEGVMGYEAQIAGVADHVAGQWLKNRLIHQLKRRSIREVMKRREEILQGIQALGVELRFVNAGGTGSMDSSRLERGVTEITVGSGFYSPTLFDHYTGFQYLPAAGYAVEIVRKPRVDMVTCLGGGYTASGGAGIDKVPQPYLPEGLKLISLEGAGEVQTPLRCPSGLQLALGDPIFFRHAKAGELCERFAKLYAISGEVIVDEYLTYRGEGECFL
ncbi:amino acid deaminase/aldolase [Paenibacillus glacialis]|uniref:Amino acid aldolase n=1 Tax=Paenibacillus glacialis TaxID=494026 RepID=A0A168EL94_9BACL|nr:amino acid deaminase/aldolase [Paenibacillus glacialis]OAB35301.1 amino acid aldolase [Paenibacillus glacialis]